MSIEHAPECAAPGPRKLIRKKRVLELIPVSFPTLWEWMRQGKFPLPVALGDAPNAPKAWYEDEVIAKQESLQRVEYKPATEPTAA